MKRIFAFMLVLCMVFALAACGSAKSPAGSWTAKVNLADIAGDSMGEMADYLKDMMVDVNLDMNEDKTFVLKMDANSAIPALKEGMRAYMNDMLTGMGMTAEDYEAAAGASLDDLIDGRWYTTTYHVQPVGGVGHVTVPALREEVNET